MRVLVYAPAALHREAWQALLARQPDIVVGGTSAETDGLLRLNAAREPTAVLVDVGTPDLDIIRRIHAAVPDGGLLVLVPAYDLPSIIELLQAGVTGVIARDEPVADLSRALIAAGRGEVVLPPAIAGKTLSTPAHQGALPIVDARIRMRYTPLLQTDWPAGLSMLLEAVTIVSMLLPAAFMVREKEQGTIEQL